MIDGSTGEQPVDHVNGLDERREGTRRPQPHRAEHHRAAGTEPHDDPSRGDLGERGERGGGRDRMAAVRVRDPGGEQDPLRRQRHRGQRDVDVAVGSLVGHDHDRRTTLLGGRGELSQQGDRDDGVDVRPPPGSIDHGRRS